MAEYLTCKKRKSWPTVPIEVCIAHGCKYLDLEAIEYIAHCKYKPRAQKRIDKRKKAKAK